MVLRRVLIYESYRMLVQYSTSEGSKYIPWTHVHSPIIKNKNMKVPVLNHCGSTRSLCDNFAAGLYSTDSRKCFSGNAKIQMVTRGKINHRGYVCVCMRGCVDVCMCGCVDVWMCVCVCVYVRACVYIYMCVCMCMCVTRQSRRAYQNASNPLSTSLLI